MRGDDQLPAAQVPHVVERRQRLILEVHQPLGVLQQHLAGVGQHPTPARPIEERLADLIFETLDDLADGGLCPVERLGRFGEAAFAHDGHECFELEQVHRASDYKLS